MKEFQELLQGIDWSLLRKQKAELQAYPKFDGIVHLIDALQDVAVANKIATEKEVFGDEITSG